MKRLVFRMRIGPGMSGGLETVLASRTGLSLAAIREAMEKGALWTVRGRHRERIRNTPPATPDGYAVELCYDRSLLSLSPPVASCISDQDSYSVWNKPVGLLSQGTQFGDHCSLLRQAELFFRPSRPVYLVHRLDREAMGIMLLAHTKAAAEKLSRLFREHRIRKTYCALVLGRVGEPGGTGRIEIELDGKPAKTEYRVESYLSEGNVSTVRVTIETGRLHQIRRHFEMLGHPVMGDPKYGKGNKNRQGLQLRAVGLEFFCPFRKKQVSYVLPDMEETAGRSCITAPSGESSGF